MMDIDDLPQHAKRNENQTVSFFKKLKKKQLNELDDIIHGLHHDVFEEINCLECANCCKCLGPRITNRDIEQIAEALRIKPAKVTETYLRVDEDNDYVFKQMPCPFLDADNYCIIYKNRPKACREYPHTDRKNFYQIHRLTIKNAETCPAVSEILERLKKEYRNNK